MMRLLSSGILRIFEKVPINSKNLYLSLSCHYLLGSSLAHPMDLSSGILRIFEKVPINSKDLYLSLSCHYLLGSSLAHPMDT
jgi:hypothetical protein